MSAPLTRDYARFTASLRPDALPAGVAEVVRLGFTDCAGVMLAGAPEPAVVSLLAHVRQVGGAPRAPLLFGTERASTAQAAFVGAVAAHALDYDDYAFSNHPSAVLVPTILAVAAESGADGPRMAAAYAAGYEVWADLMLREPDHIYFRGWHPTAMFGPVGAAAAAAVAYGLDEERTLHALALAASLAGGVFENFGTMAKPMHGGRAAESGVVAAGLARAGLEASPSALEGERGLMRAISPAMKSDRESPSRLGERWRILELKLNIKKYPTVGASQRVIDSVLAYRRSAGAPSIKTIERVMVHISDRHDEVMPFHLPITGLQAKFSAEFAAGCALQRGAVGLAELTDGVVNDPALQALMARTVRDITTEHDPVDHNAAPFDFVRLTLRGGQTVDTPSVRRARGHASAPLDAEEVRAKFDGCADAVGANPASAGALFDAMQRIDGLRGVDDVPVIRWTK